MWAASVAAFFTRISRAFFGIQAQDSGLKTGLRVGGIAGLRVVYGILDYWFAILAGTYIVTMDRVFGFGPVALFFLMWVFDITVAQAFVVVWRRTGQDVTLGESYRRAVDEIHRGSKLAGRIAILGVLLKATIWDGPEHIVIFFAKEIRTEFRMLMVLLFLTAIQAAFWAPTYVLGYDAVVELIKHM